MASLGLHQTRCISDFPTNINLSDSQHVTEAGSTTRSAKERHATLWCGSLAQTVALPQSNKFVIFLWGTNRKIWANSLVKKQNKKKTTRAGVIPKQLIIQWFLYGGQTRFKDVLYLQVWRYVGRQNHVEVAIFSLGKQWMACLTDAEKNREVLSETLVKTLVFFLSN